MDNEITITAIEDILTKADEAMESVNNALLALETVGLEYIGKYDTYNREYLRDADILKEKTKNAVIMAVNDDI